MTEASAGAVSPTNSIAGCGRSWLRTMRTCRPSRASSSASPSPALAHDREIARARCNAAAQQRASRRSARSARGARSAEAAGAHLVNNDGFQEPDLGARERPVARQRHERHCKQQGALVAEHGFWRACAAHRSVRSRGTRARTLSHLRPRLYPDTLRLSNPVQKNVAQRCTGLSARQCGRRASPLHAEWPGLRTPPCGTGASRA